MKYHLMMLDYYQETLRFGIIRMKTPKNQNGNIPDENESRIILAGDIIILNLVYRLEISIESYSQSSQTGSVSKTGNAKNESET